MLPDISDSNQRAVPTRHQMLLCVVVHEVILGPVIHLGERHCNPPESRIIHLEKKVTHLKTKKIFLAERSFTKSTDLSWI